MLEKIKNFVKEEEGATMVEYALLVALIGAALVAIITTLRGSIGELFTTVSEELGGAAGD